MNYALIQKSSKINRSVSNGLFQTIFFIRLFTCKYLLRINLFELKHIRIKLRRSENVPVTILVAVRKRKNIPVTILVAVLNTQIKLRRNLIKQIKSKIQMPIGIKRRQQKIYRKRECRRYSTFILNTYGIYYILSIISYRPLIPTVLVFLSTIS